MHGDIDALLGHLDLVLKQNDVGNVLGTRCLSVALLWHLALSEDPDLPMLPTLFLSTAKSAQFGEESFGLENFEQRVA